MAWYDANRVLIGLNCLQPFGWGYPYTNGGADTTVLPAARLAAIKDTGFDFVRMAVDPETLLAADGASNEVTTDLDARIDEIMDGVARRTAAGLRVIVDMHFHGFSVSYASGWQFDDVFDGGTKATRVQFVLVRLATQIDALTDPDEVAFELFNEPPAPYTIATATYTAQMASWATAVRAVMASHWMVIGGNASNAQDSVLAGSTSGLTSLDPTDYDDTVLYTFHGYESGCFTLQATSGSIYEDVHNLVFPAAEHPGGETQASDDFTAEATANGRTANIDPVVTQTTWASSLHQYFVTYGSKALLKTRETVVATWADNASVSRRRILNGEFGVNFVGTTDASVDSAMHFVRALREIAQELGFGGICVHEMQGSNFRVQNTSAPYAFDANIRQALFGQTALPVSDVSAGTWTPSTGATLFATIDDDPAIDDTDYDLSGATPVNDTMEVALQALDVPVAGDVQIVVRHRLH